MITARLRRIARDAPGALAWLGDGQSLTYADLLAVVAVARRTLEHMGTQPGDYIVASLPIGLDTVAAFFACVDLGAVFVPVNPAWRRTELTWLLKHVPAKLAIALGGEGQRWIDAGLAPERIVFAGDLAPAGEEPWREFACGGSREFARGEWPAEHPAVCIASSGSMGNPKIAVKTQGGITGTADCVGTACSLGSGNRLLVTVPPHHGSGLTNNLSTPLLNGVTLVPLGHFEPAAAAARIKRFSVDYLFSSPVLYTLMLDARVTASALLSLRLCVSTGASLGTAICEEWKRTYGMPIRQAYGSSEAGMISIQSEDSPDPRFAGRPVPMTEVRILCEDAERPSGEVGEIAVRGPGVVTRYLGASEETAMRFWNGYLRTGDLGWLDETGRLYLQGRLRPWINIGGVKVDPLEVQQAIRQMRGIRDCAVEAEQGPGGQEIVAAVIAPEPGVELTRAGVIQHCRAVLAEFKIPRVVRFVAALSSDPTGKSSRRWA